MFFYLYTFAFNSNSPNFPFFALFHFFFSLQQVREYFNLTRKQFIQIVKVDLSTVSRIETGKQAT